VIHYDPVVTGDAEQDRIRAVVETILSGIDKRISLHDFRTVRGTGHTNLIFDMALPPDLMSRQKQIKLTLDQTLAEREHGKYYTVITFDMDTFNQ
jgi:hypothetical protein